jgi:hypothetical protein
MSMRVARFFAVLWWFTFISALILGLCWIVMFEWRSHVYTAEPTIRNSLAFMSHGRTYFAPPGVVRWYDRFSCINGVLVAALVPLTLIAWAASHHSDAIRRR